jgi:hypothetical protein
MTHSNDDENSESLNSKSIANPYRMKGNNVTKQAAWDSVASYVEPFMISNMLRELKPKCTAAAEFSTTYANEFFTCMPVLNDNHYT